MFRFILTLTFACALAAQSQLEVVAAYYGANRQFMDVTDAVRGLAQTDGLNFTVGGGPLGGDPQPGVSKTLRLYYRWNGELQTAQASDGEPLRLGRFASQGRRGNGRETARMPSADPAGTLTITRATYGAAGGASVDATAMLQSRVQDSRLEFPVNSTNLPDPAPGVVKELVVAYTWQGRTRETRVTDGGTLRLPPGGGPGGFFGAATATPTPTLKIVSATYGSGNRTADVTALVTSRVTSDRLSISADNTALGVDPARGATKTLAVVYEWAGQRQTATAREGQTLQLPTTADLNVAGTPSDGICFYPGANFQGPPTCSAVDRAQLTGQFGSLRLLGRARSVDLFESPEYGGRTIRLTGDQADLSQVSAGGGGFFGNSSQYAWAARPGSFRLQQ